MAVQIKGLSPEMSQRIINYVNSKTTNEMERQAMINDLVQDAINYENQQKVNQQRESMKADLRTKISKETRTKQSNQLKATLRSADLADMIRDFSQKNGGNVAGLSNDEDLLNKFLEKNPNYAKDVQKYLNGSIGNMDIGKRLGFIDGIEDPQNSIYQDQKLEEPGFWAKVGQRAKDIVGGISDSVYGVPRLIGKGIANGVGWTAKKLGADKNKVNYYVNDFKKYIDEDANDIGQDKDSLTYNISNTVADITQVATPTGVVNAGAKGVKLVNTTTKMGTELSKAFPKAAKVINNSERAVDNMVSLVNKAGGKIDQLTTKVPTLGKILKNGISGAGDMVLFNAVNGEGTSLGEAGLGAGIGAAFPVLGIAGKGAKKLFGRTASKLELNGIINPAKLETVRSQLIAEGATLPGKGTAEDVGKWMLERGFKGNKDKIVEQLTEHANKSKGMVDELLGLSKSTHKVPEVNQALEMLYKDYINTPGLASKADDLVKLAKDEYTIAEMNQVKRYLDDAYNMFKSNGGETAGLKAEGLRNIRSTIKNTIEDIAEKEGLGNIRMLNNETQVARGLIDGITKKEAAASVRELLSPFQSSAVGGLVGGTQGGSWEERIKNAAIGMILGKAAGSTRVKTYLANGIKGLGGIEKKELTEYLASNGKSALSEGGQKALLQIAKQDEELGAAIKEIEAKNAKQEGLFGSTDIKKVAQSELKTSDDVYKYAMDNKQQIFEQYGKEHGSYVNPDDFRPLINNGGKIEASVTHEGASSLADEYFNTLLSKSGKGDRGVVVAGGPGSGKGYSASKLGIDPKDFNIFVDKTKGNKELVKMIDKGMDVDYYVVIPNADNIVDQIAGRALSKGRTLPINSRGLPTHKEVVEVVEKVLQMQKDGSNFRFHFVTNPGKGGVTRELGMEEGYKLFKEYASKLEGWTPEKVEQVVSQYKKQGLSDLKIKELLASLGGLLAIGSLVGNENEA